MKDYTDDPFNNMNMPEGDNVPIDAQRSNYWSEPSAEKPKRTDEEDDSVEEDYENDSAEDEDWEEEHSDNHH